MALRSYKSTRIICSILVDGESEKGERVKAQIPDATYTNCDGTVERLADLIRQTAQKARQAPLGERYAGVPLARNLGIRTGYNVSLVGASYGFRVLIVE